MYTVYPNTVPKSSPPLTPISLDEQLGVFVHPETGKPVCRTRGQLDFYIRKTILAAAVRGDKEACVPLYEYASSWDSVLFHTYWTKYAEAIGVKLLPDTENHDHMPVSLPSYPEIRLPLVVFSSAHPSGFPPGGVESAFTRQALYNVPVLHIDAKSYEHEDIGMLEGALAILASQLGYGCALIGNEMSSWGTEIDPNEGESFHSPYTLEQTDYWWRLWNKYRAPTTIQSLAGVWHKDELILKVDELTDITKISSCFDAIPEKLWCSRCFKCWVTDLVLHLEGNRTPTVKAALTVDQATESAMRVEYMEYKRTGVDLYRWWGIVDRLCTKHKLLPDELFLSYAQRD